MSKCVTIKKPYVKQFESKINGEVVSYSPRSNKIAVGLNSVVIPKYLMEEILKAADSCGQQFTLAVSAFIKYM